MLSEQMLNRYNKKTRTHYLMFRVKNTVLGENVNNLTVD